MAALMSIVLGFFLFLPAKAGLFNANSSRELLRESVKKENWTDAARHSQALGSDLSGRDNKDQQKDLFRLTESMALHRQGKIEESIKLLEPIPESSLYFVWAQVFLARLAYVSHNIELLGKTLQALDKVPLKGDIKTEKRFYEAHLLIEQQKWLAAAKILRQLERPSRGTDLYVPVVEAMALVESNTQNANNVCRTIKRLYIKHPKHRWFKNTAPEIKNVPIGDKQYACIVNEREFDQRKRNLNLTGDFKIASDEMKRWFALAGTTPKQQKLMEAQQIMAEGHPEESVKILKSVQVGDTDIQVLRPLSFAAARAGDMKLAIDSSLATYSVLGASKEGNMALYQAAAWAYQTRDYDSAEQRFKRVRVNRLSKAYRKEVQWYQGWLRYLKGDYVAAEKGFRNLQKGYGRKTSADSSDRLQYWLAMTLMKQGKSEKARVLFQKLNARKGMHYYSFLAKERLKQLPERKPTSELVEPKVYPFVVARGIYYTPYGEEAPWPSSQESEVTDEEVESGDSDEANLLAEEESNSEAAEDEKVADSIESSAGELFSQGEANQKLERAKAFWSVGLEDLARREVGDLERYSRGFDIFRRVTDEYRQMGLYNKMTVLGQGFAGRANLNSNKFVYEAIYPRAYAEFVERYAAEHNVALALVWGIMKAESMYRSWVKSPVGALGLMQVMPTTGQKLAEMMEYKNFSPTDLLQPPVAIRFGSKYLERLGKKFDNSVQLVAAAYNAGPHRVSQWLYYFGYMQMDEWVEHIPFVETRNYVKKVTVNYMAYNEIYGKGLGDTLALIDPVPVQIAGAPETKESWE